MSIDEVMAAASRLATTTAVFTTPSGDLDTDGESAVQERSMQLRAAIKQHVAEAVAREREECALICDAEGREWGSDAVVTLKNYAEHCAAAIRARAEKETT